jgi:hypothetical protein
MQQEEMRRGNGPAKGQQGKGQAGNRGFGRGGQANGSDVNVLRLWEEEKLARDVYAKLAETTGLMIFRNIARSESQHMQALARTMRTRGAQAQPLNDAPGQFSFADYQRLYRQLVADGSRGPMEALMVGAKIEEMDIADLQRLIATTKDRQLSQVMQRLLRGSQNHLRAFDSQLVARGATYKPQFLNQAQYDQVAKGGMANRGQQGMHGKGSERQSGSRLQQGPSQRGGRFGPANSQPQRRGRGRSQ